MMPPGRHYAAAIALKRQLCRERAPLKNAKRAMRCFSDFAIFAAFMIAHYQRLVYACC